ncbi:MAG: hypothetical protein KC516_00975 [Nanoarchaeota archaeon]|nr:hypothetical protein [Nanoarchaeota archaeon]
MQKGEINYLKKLVGASYKSLEKLKKALDEKKINDTQSSRDEILSFQNKIVEAFK